MKRLLSLTVVLCVVLAGCGGIGGTDQTASPTNTATTTATASPTPTPTATPTPTPTPSPAEYLASQSLPTGLESDGVSNTTDLVATHQEQLETTGATVNMTIASSGGQQSTRTVITRTIGADGTSMMAYDINSSFGSIQSEIYRNDSVALLNQTVRNETSYSVVESKSLTPGGGINSSLTQYISLGDYDVASVDRSGDTQLVTLVSAGLNESKANSTMASDIHAYNGTLVVDLSGRIHSFDANITSETFGGNKTQTISYDVERLGVDSVSPPDWTGTAYEKATLVDLSVSLENDTIVITHEGGDTIPATASISAVKTETNESERPVFFTVTLEESLEPGESLTVYLPENATYRGAATRGASPEEARAELSGAFRLSISDQETGEVIAVKVTDDDN